MAATWDQLLDPEDLALTSQGQGQGPPGDVHDRESHQHHQDSTNTHNSFHNPQNRGDEHMHHEPTSHFAQNRHHDIPTLNPAEDHSSWDPEVIFDANQLPSSFFDHFADSIDINWAAMHGGGQLPMSEPSAFLTQGDINLDLALAAQSLPLSSPRAAQDSSVSPVDSSQVSRDFFLPRGAFRPPHPCAYCKRFRLNCFLLQSTIVNPNPLQSCSVCVALYRQCSFAERPKRRPQGFETAGPVIGNLHGVAEEEDGEDPFQQGDAMAEDLETQHDGKLNLGERGRKTRSVRKTRALRNWMNCHLEEPYPSEVEKADLAEESGLTMTQVNNWFANARRRRKHLSYARERSGSRGRLRAGSPLPRSRMSSSSGSRSTSRDRGGEDRKGKELTPLDRWRNSPPEHEGAEPSAIEKAVRRRSGEDIVVGSRKGSRTRSFSAASESSFSSAGRYASSNSDASCYFSDQNEGRLNDFPGAAASTATGTNNTAAATVAISSGRRGKPRTVFYCTFCTQPFKKKYDWLRHERSVHMPSLSLYICSPPLSEEVSPVLWRMHSTGPECLYCGEASPSPEHFSSHEWESCLEKPEDERTFTRKDHLWQHMKKFHRCKRWEGWEKVELENCRRVRDGVKSWCGFCGVEMASWGDRGEHVAAHFRDGLSLGDWTGGCGVEGWEDGGGGGGWDRED